MQKMKDTTLDEHAKRIGREYRERICD